MAGELCKEMTARGKDGGDTKVRKLLHLEACLLCKHFKTPQSTRRVAPSRAVFICKGIMYYIFCHLQSQGKVSVWGFSGRVRRSKSLPLTRLYQYSFNRRNGPQKSKEKKAGIFSYRLSFNTKATIAREERPLNTCRHSVVFCLATY